MTNDTQQITLKLFQSPKEPIRECVQTVLGLSTANAVDKMTKYGSFS